MVTHCMPRVEQMASHAVFGLRRRRHFRLRVTVSSLRYSPLSAT